MQPIIKTTSLRLNPALRGFLENKINSLERFLPSRFTERGIKGKKFTAQIRCEVGMSSRHHKKDGIYYTEIQILLPGRLLRAESKNWDLKVAINNVVRVLAREIRQYKKSAKARELRGQRLIKRSVSAGAPARTARVRDEGA